MVKIKICGITNKTDALAAARLGADMIGFVFYQESKRNVDPVVCRDIANELPSDMDIAGVFVDEERETVLSRAEDVGLTMLQFHGRETPEYCASFRDHYKVIKAFRLKDRDMLKMVNDYDADYYLFDTFKGDSVGGTGEAFDWTVLRDFEILKPVILAGGLTPDNVERAIEDVMPYGVDVSTGVESTPGHKDMELMKRFIENARRAG